MDKARGIGMRKRNIAIVVLFMIGMILAAAAIFGTHEIGRQKSKQWNEQFSITGNQWNLIKNYQSQYMGDSSNIVGLFYHLPLGSEKMTYQIDSEAFVFEIDYEQGLAQVGIHNHNVSKEKNYSEKKDRKKGEREAYQAMIYNSVIAFSLIDNLQGIRYRFKDHCFFITRERLMQSGQFVLPIQEEEGANCLKENILGQKNIEKLFTNLFIKE